MDLLKKEPEYKPEKVKIWPASIQFQAIPSMSPTGAVITNLYVVGMGSDERIYHYEGKVEKWVLQR